MKVRELMTRDVETCDVGMTVASVVDLLWRRDCGLIPVVDAARKVVGVLTDRDICIALGTRNRVASSLSAGEVMSTKVVLCEADDDVKTAIEKMRKWKVRRLPVTDGAGTIQGLLSLNDLVRCAAPSTSRNGAVNETDVMNVLKSVCEQRVPLPSAVIARR